MFGGIFMDKYLEILAKQYIRAKDIRTKADLNDPKFVEDLLFWIRERNEIGNKYTTFLEELGIDFDNDSCAEIGKSTLDTVVGPYSTFLITTTSKPLGNIDRDRVIDGSLEVIDSTPYLNAKNRRLELPSYIFDTYMTQNIYDMKDIESWTDLHNSGKYNIVVGAYGNTEDKDIYPILNKINLFQEKLDTDTIYEYTMIGDSYLVVAASKKAIKEKVKTI